MEKQLEIISNSQTQHWLDIAEVVSLIGSIGGSIASLFLKEVILASIPLSICVALNLVNRRRLLSLTDQEIQQAIAELVKNNQEQQTNFAEKITQWQDSANERFTDYQTKQQNLARQLVQFNIKVNKRTQKLQREYKNLASNLENLSEIESLTVAIQAYPNSAELYFHRGNSYQKMGNQEQTLEDYTKAIAIDSSYALAYHHRGMLNSELGNKKAAVEDLRKAAKFYFEQGDIDNYEKTKSMSQALHELNSNSQKQEAEEVLASSLFS